MAKIVTMGEIMLRLSPPDNKRFIQTTSFDATYGGSEANIAVSLSNYGHDVSFVTKLPINPLGDCAIGTLRKSGVDCTKIPRGEGRIGTYYLEMGCSVRPSSVIYDRADSVMANAKPEDFDWDKIFDGVDLFHTSGITPVISSAAPAVVKEALIQAKKRNITVSFDLNYRGKLWQTGVEEKRKMMSELMQYVDICLGNARDAAMVLGYTDGDTDFIGGSYDICINEENLKKVMKTYGFKYLFSSMRESISASDNIYGAVIATDNGRYESKKYPVHIVDRVGTGDAFAAGFLHGIVSGRTPENALEFAAAAAAIKHTIPGDMMYATEVEVDTLAGGDGAARVVR